MKKILLFILFTFGLHIMTCKAPNLNVNEKAFRIEFINNYLKSLEIKKEINEIKHSEFSVELLKKYLKLKGVKHSKIIIRQFALETGYFQSKSFTRYHNICGMKRAKIRPTTAIGSGYGHAAYKHWTDSVDDYILWQKYYKDKLTASKNYYDFLEDVGYAENSRYVTLIKQMKLT